VRRNSPFHTNKIEIRVVLTFPFIPSTVPKKKTQKENTKKKHKSQTKTQETQEKKQKREIWQGPSRASTKLRRLCVWQWEDEKEMCKKFCFLFFLFFLFCFCTFFFWLLFFLVNFFFLLGIGFLCVCLLFCVCYFLCWTFVLKGVCLPAGSPRRLYELPQLIMLRHRIANKEKSTRKKNKTKTKKSENQRQERKNALYFFVPQSRGQPARNFRDLPLLFCSSKLGPTSEKFSRPVKNSNQQRKERKRNKKSEKSEKQNLCTFFTTHSKVRNSRRAFPKCKNKKKRVWRHFFVLLFCCFVVLLFLYFLFLYFLCTFFGFCVFLFFCFFFFSKTVCCCCFLLLYLLVFFFWFFFWLVVCVCLFELFYPVGVRSRWTVTIKVNRFSVRICQTNLFVELFYPVGVRSRWTDFSVRICQ